MELYGWNKNEDDELGYQCESQGLTELKYPGKLTFCSENSIQIQKSMKVRI